MLKDRVSSSAILPLAFFSVTEWRSRPDKLCTELTAYFGSCPLIVRSSAHGEDSKEASLAGKFASVLGVSGVKRLKQAIDSVIDSYGTGLCATDEVLVQPMLKQVSLSGVAFSHDPATRAPYRVIEYSWGNDTTAVTAGQAKTQTLVVGRGKVVLPSNFSRVVAMLDELEQLFPGQPLDVEFALTCDDHLPYLLQVRPLIIKRPLVGLLHHQRLITRIADKIRVAQQPHPFLHGRSTVFGVMPDWNPAEIIGIRPRPLALSLYRELVTDSIWAYQRDNYGYRNLRSFPLLVHFAGQPYIDVRLSFNSFIPKAIDGSLADRLVDYYIDRLVAAPKLHDKVEFEVVYSCYTLDLDERMRALVEAGFSDEECRQLADALRALTNRIIDRKAGLWREDEAKLAMLTRRREQIEASSMSAISRIYWLLEDCKRYGTLPFAGLARAGFIAVQFLKSLVSIGVLSNDDFDRFMKGLNTVSSQLARDMAVLERPSFLQKYGHLRPGTYDILSPRYDEAPDNYLGSAAKYPCAQSEKRYRFALALDQMRAIAKLLAEHGLSSDVVSLFDFLQAGIELREYSKFMFTRNLSDAISLFRDWGSTHGFSPDQLSFANIGCIRELYASTDDPKTVLARSIAEGQDRYAETSALWLPPLITHPDEVWAFHVPESEPNFITQGSVTGHVVVPELRQELAGGIVFIPSADPGFDWLFSHPIGGLVTAYGGANSHMAIRANELGLPSVIGAGETLFKQWSRARMLHVNCSTRRVEVLS
jgi:phosphohistidine swiveling domain-containing protein